MESEHAVMRMQPLEIGAYERYRVSERVDPANKQVRLTRWVWARVLGVSPSGGKVKIALVGEAGRVRWVKPERLF